MPTLTIKKLLHNEEAVCRALFDAAAKTEEGIKTKQKGIQTGADMPGLWSRLNDSEIEDDLRKAKVQRSGRMREIGYLTVNLLFHLNELDVTEYEKLYGISAKEVLEKAGFTIGDDSLSNISAALGKVSLTPSYPKSNSSVNPASTFSSISVPETKSEKPPQTGVVSRPFFSLKSVEADKRFTKSTKPGILYEARSYSVVDDDTLKSYGFIEGQWERQKEKSENVVLIKNLVTTAPSPSSTQQTLSRNVIFLDIDGVLLKNSNGDRNRKTFEENLPFIQSKLGDQANKLSLYDIGAALLFSKDAVDNLKTLCEKTNAKIVISSNWRIDDEERREESLAKLRGLFKLWDLDSLIIDQTPHLSGSRAKEIKAWLAHTKNKVDNFVIIDDVDSGLSANFPGNFINTGNTSLFTTKHLEEALSVFDVTAHSTLSL